MSGNVIDKFRTQQEEINHEEIIEAGERWEDETFPASVESLLNEDQDETEVKGYEREVWEGFTWCRPE